MKVTYKEFLRAIKAADAIMVDGNLTCPAIDDFERIDMSWSDEDGQFYDYHAEDSEELTVTLWRDGSFALNGLFDDDGEFCPCETVVKLLKITPYKKKGKK